ncbi:MAG: lysophospholipid acyltransferase family protein [Deltaproteobacteria bacterium]|jgi:predicted LPLAT superfamily acyltransferase|nr:lysophospholipid acyltransferase family protein [Deltaproteobacteria bacterium]MBT4637300.1 lysophospholipid acyltransferase family protein [Deltaproteobacteria bacterium]MBT6504344.1 lysophospholipid acyltransferase family protein [Deltaproteobacteria bacterium]MBT7154570.1 lysophospholipid acyltransferase family protein [Deltaproteobacteria bacterium]MBT7716421.1 lysophospholipid acyltransferase family protein [Deltaproteobacteria bacterium]
MIAMLYRGALLISKWVGNWFLSMIARIIAAGFFVFLPGRVRRSALFYRARFPKKGTLHAYFCVWRQYQNFTSLFLNQLLLLDFSRISVTSEGWEALEQTLNQGKGAIMLTSHVGNWEVAAHLLKKQQPDIRLLIYMGARNSEQIEKMQKKKLVDEGIRIIAVEHDSGSAFHLIEANTFLNEGGLVALTGDRIWHTSQRAVQVNFLGREVNLPESPHLLALISERPLFVMFPVKTGKRQYHIRICPPIFVKAENRADRKNAVKRSAQAYADLLSEATRRHPFEWYNFEMFPGEPLERKDS